MGRNKLNTASVQQVNPRGITGTVAKGTLTGGFPTKVLKKNNIMSNIRT